MSSSWSEARRILAVRLDAMGDVLMTEPALRALSQRGSRQVTLLTSPAGAAVAPLLREVHDTIVYEAPWMKASATTDPRTDAGLIEQLRGRAFDGAVIFTVHTQSSLPAALVCHLAGIPLRAAHCRENPYRLLTDWIRDPEPALQRHEVERQLALVAELGFAADGEEMRLRIGDAARRAARSRLAAAGVDRSRPWLALHPGASAPSRRYPLDRYAAALRALVDEGWQAVLLGGTDDAGTLAALQASVGCRNVAAVGDLALDELAATVEAASVFIGNNSGPTHVAAAVGTPSVVLYALTNPQHTPWRTESRVLFHDVPCRNCLRSVCPLGHHLCLRGVDPQQVVDAVHELDAVRHASRVAV